MTATSDSRGKRLLSLAAPALTTLMAFALLMTLGTWQLHRLAWKLSLIERVEERVAMPPVDLRGTELAEIGDPQSFLDLYEYQPAILEGEYDPAGEVLVFTSLSDAKGPFAGPGYWVMTPLIAAPRGEVVYVNRGFVPQERKDDFAPAPQGVVTPEGLIRAPEQGSLFTPNPNLEGRIFFARDPQRIADAMGEERRTAGFFIDLLAPETPPTGLPQAGETRFVFPNDHLGYAITWYGLAGALLVVFAVFAWRRLHEPASGPRLTPPGAAS